MSREEGRWSSTTSCLKNQLWLPAGLGPGQDAPSTLPYCLYYNDASVYIHQCKFCTLFLCSDQGETMASLPSPPQRGAHWPKELCLCETTATTWLQVRAHMWSVSPAPTPLNSHHLSSPSDYYSLTSGNDDMVLAQTAAPDCLVNMPSSSGAVMLGLL